MLAMADFARFATRDYPTVDPRRGYAEWAGSYEESVEDALDLDLLDALSAVPWRSMRRAADLACGTGRTAAYLRRRGVAAIDGVDLTPEMLVRARTRGAHDRLVLADVADTGLAAAAYDLVVTSLVDEHLPELGPLYGEAFRLARPGGAFVLVGLHPHFLMATGMPTHFHRESGAAVAIETHVHLLGEHASAALAAAWTLAELRERVVDDGWVALKPQWERWRGHPVSFAFVWRRDTIRACAG
jgi:SAM-dependent methyltransferase